MAGHFTRKCDRSSQQISFDDPVNQSEPSASAALTGLPETHIEIAAGNPNQTRKPLCSFSPRDDSKIHFGLAHLRVGWSPPGSGRPSRVPALLPALFRGLPSRQVSAQFSICSSRRMQIQPACRGPALPVRAV